MDRAVEVLRIKGNPDPDEFQIRVDGELKLTLSTREMSDLLDSGDWAFYEDLNLNQQRETDANRYGEVK